MSWTRLLALASLLGGCVASSYAKDLDTCILQNMPDHAAVVQCQCAVSGRYGRSCAWLDAAGTVTVHDGGAE